jgi:hypothetical protein
MNWTLQSLGTSLRLQTEQSVGESGDLVSSAAILVSHLALLLLFFYSRV